MGCNPQKEESFALGKVNREGIQAFGHRDFDSEM
jgi:hypothetical protein